MAVHELSFSHNRFRSPPGSAWLFRNPTAGFIWLLVRLWVGWQWLMAGEHKLFGGSSVGWVHGGVVKGKPVHAGDNLLHFWQHAVAPSPAGTMPQVAFGWYREFLRFLIDHHTQAWFAHLIAWGELLVGVGLLLGAFTAVSACCGALLNLNYMLAGSASLNPVLFLGAVLLVLAWRIAGLIGLDRWLLPLLGTPWQPGWLVQRLRPARRQPERGERRHGRAALPPPAYMSAFHRRRRHVL